MKQYRFAGFSAATIVSIFLTSCFQNKDKKAAYSNKSIEISTQIINDYTQQQYYVLAKRSRDYATRERVKIWLTNADTIQSLTKAARLSIDSCLENADNSSDDQNKSALIGIATKYKSAVLQVDTILARELSKELSQIVDSIYLRDFNSLAWGNELKAKIQNSIAVIANKAIAFCDLKASPGCILTFEQFSALVGQNSTHFRSGDKLEITAGIGSFSPSPNPKIMINNERISLNNDLFAVFKKTVTGKPGEYIIPVIIDYTAPDGTQKKQSLKIKYYIDQ